MIGCLQTCVRKLLIIALYLEFENELKFNNLEAKIEQVMKVLEGVVEGLIRQRVWIYEMQFL